MSSTPSPGEIPGYQATNKRRNAFMFLYLKFYGRTDRNKKKLAGLKIPEEDQIILSRLVDIMSILLQNLNFW